MILIHRGDALSAQASYRDAVAANAKIELRFNAVVEEILGEAKVAGLRVRDTATGRIDDMDLAGVFAYIGMEPNTAFLAGQVGLDAGGRIATGRRAADRIAGPSCRGIGSRGLARPGRDLGGRGRLGRSIGRGLSREWCMVSGLTGTRSSRLPAQGDGQAPRAPSRKPSTASSSTWSTACSIIPKSSWISFSAGSASICPR